MTRFAVALAALLSSGCSLLFVRPPPGNHWELERFDCTSNNVAPVIDFIGGGLSVAGAVFAASANDATWTGPIDRTASVGVNIGIAALSVLSTIYGLTVTGNCREAERDMYVRLAARNNREAAATAAIQAAARAAPRRVPAASLTIIPDDGCSKDTDCKGLRICEARECVAPK